jgi:hypothetical protein
MRTSTVRARDMDGAGRIDDAWRAAQYGVLWGLATTGMETLAMPFTAVVGSLDSFVAVLMPYWCLKSVLAAWFALRAERRFRGPRLLGLLLLVGLGLAPLSMAWILVLLAEQSVYRHGVQPSAIFWYDAWSTLFYGSLLAMGCIVASRANRMRRLLDQAQIDRGLSEALLAEIRLKELQASVNPEVLYGALAEVMRRYVAGLPSADRLLDCLVGFLRSAMPSLRGTASTLGAELELTRAYVRLRAELDPQRDTWWIEGIEATDDMGTLLVPPLQLIDMLDRWTGSDTGRTGGVMAITRCAGGVRVELRTTVESQPASAGSPAAMTFDFLNPATLPGTG